MLSSSGDAPRMVRCHVEQRGYALPRRPVNEMMTPTFLKNMRDSAREPGALYPTHQCFDDVLEFMMRGIEANARVVHAVVQTQDFKFSHAWAEFTDRDGLQWCMDGRFVGGVLVFAMRPAAMFFQTLHEHKRVEYGREEYFCRVDMTRTSGPWDEEILKWCANSSQQQSA